VEAGLRVGEIRGLQWTDIKSGQLTVRRALDKLTNEAVAPKHNKTRTVPLSPRLAAVLQDLPRRGLWVIPDADGSFVTYDVLSAAINAIYELANVRRPPKPLHCLRHTFGTVMAKRVPLPVLQKLMGACRREDHAPLCGRGRGRQARRDRRGVWLRRGSHVAARTGAWRQAAVTA
jgi:integrase